MGAPAMFRDKAIELAQRGMRPGTIAREFGVAPDVIYQLLSGARRAGVDIPRFAGGPFPDAKKNGNQLRVRIAPRHLPALDRAANDRGISRSQLVSRLLEVLVMDDLVDAILDDGGHADD